MEPKTYNIGAIITVMFMQKIDPLAPLSNCVNAFLRAIGCHGNRVLMGTASLLFVALSAFPQLTNRVGAIADCVGREPLNVTIKADATDTFTAWARVKADLAAEIRLAQDEQCASAPIAAGQAWAWVKFDNKVSLKQGSQVASITTKSQVIFLDKLLFTVDTTCTPVNEGDNCVLEGMDIDITGVEQEVAKGVDLRIAAQIHGAGADTPQVSFMLDDKVFEGKRAVQNEALYCAVEPLDEICGVVRNSELDLGPHMLSVSAKDGDRMSVVNVEFTVVEMTDRTTLEANKDAGNQKPTLPIRHSSDEQPDLVGRQLASPNRYAALNESNPNSDISQSAKVPTFVIGQGAVLGDTLSGEIGLSVPASLVKKGDEKITYKVDGDVIGTITARELPYIVNTSDFDNHGHQFEALISSSDGVESAVEVAAIVNNSPFLAVKSWVATRTARIILMTTCLTVVVLLVVLELRKLVKAKRMQEVTGVNTQAIGYVKGTRTIAQGYGMLAIVVLTTVGAALLIAPATPAYSGNASVTIQPEDDRVNYIHETGSSTEISSQYIILR